MTENLLVALKNEVTVIGRLKEMNLEAKENKKGVECIMGEVVILVEEKLKDGTVRPHDIRARFYSNKFNKKGEISGLYTRYKKLIDNGVPMTAVETKQEASLVSLQGSLGLREYIPENGTIQRFNNVEGKFIEIISKEDVVKRKGPRAVAVVEGYVKSIKEEVDSEGLPTERLELNLHNVDFFGDNPNPDYDVVIPIKAIVPEHLTGAFEGLYDVNETGKFTLKINNYAVEAEEEEIEQEVAGFGQTDELKERVSVTYENSLEVVGGTEPYNNGREYDEEQIEQAEQFRKIALERLEEGYSPTSDNAFGEGSKTETDKKVETTDDKVLDDIDVDELDF